MRRAAGCPTQSPTPPLRSQRTRDDIRGSSWQHRDLVVRAPLLVSAEIEVVAIEEVYRQDWRYPETEFVRELVRRHAVVLPGENVRPGRQAGNRLGKILVVAQLDARCERAARRVQQLADERTLRLKPVESGPTRIGLASERAIIRRDRGVDHALIAAPKVARVCDRIADEHAHVPVKPFAERSVGDGRIDEVWDVVPLTLPVEAHVEIKIAPQIRSVGDEVEPRHRDVEPGKVIPNRRIDDAAEGLLAIALVRQADAAAQ